MVAVGPSGFISVEDLPHGINYHDKSFKEAVIWKKLGNIIPKFPVSDYIKDGAISYTSVYYMPERGFFPRGFSVSLYHIHQMVVIQEMLNRTNHRDKLKNDYNRMEGFVDALLDEIEAEIKAKKDATKF